LKRLCLDSWISSKSRPVLKWRKHLNRYLSLVTASKKWNNAIHNSKFSSSFIQISKKSSKYTAPLSTLIHAISSPSRICSSRKLLWNVKLFQTYFIIYSAITKIIQDLRSFLQNKKPIEPPPRIDNYRIVEISLVKVAWLFEEGFRMIFDSCWYINNKSISDIWWTNRWTNTRIKKCYTCNGSKQPSPISSFSNVSITL
jgi:hypothetical protein